MVALILAAIIAVAAAMGGVVVASDSAAPGDALYGVDRTVESIRVKMARDEARTALLMELAEERLQEAGEADEDNVDAALEEYMAALDELLNAVIESGEADPEQLAALLEALDDYEEQLRAILDDLEDGGDDTPGDAPDDGEDDQDDPDDGEDDQDDPNDGDDDQDTDDVDDEQDEDARACVGADPHPVVMALSQSYDYEYDEIMSWFCSGYGLGEIKHALAAENAMPAGEDGENGDQNGGYTAEEILALKTELGGWGQVWQHLGRIGKGRNPHNISDPGDRELRAPDEPTVEGDDAADDEPQSPPAEPTAEPQGERPGNGNGNGNGNNGRGNGNIPPGHREDGPGNGRGNNGNNENNGRGNGNIPPGHRDDRPGNPSARGNNGNGNNGRGNGQGRGR